MYKNYNLNYKFYCKNRLVIMQSLAKSLSPGGILRASINLGNPILAHLDPTTGKPGGISVELSTALAYQLGLPLELVVFDSAGKSVDAVTNDQADIGFFAIDPIRGAGLHFTAPYVLIEGSYLVRENSALVDNSEVDRAQHRVVVGKGSAYDLHLTRELKQAKLVRAQNSQSVVDTFIQEGCEVATGVKQQLEMDLKRVGRGYRILPGSFMVI